MTTWIVRMFTQEARVTAASLTWEPRCVVFRDDHGRIVFTQRIDGIVDLYDEAADRQVEFTGIGGTPHA